MTLQPLPPLRRPGTGPDTGAHRPYPAGPGPGAPRPGELHVGQHQAGLQPGLAPVCGLDEGPWPRPPPAGDAGPGGRLPGGGGRGGPVGGHPPPAGSGAGQGPPVRWPPGPHR